MIDSGFFAVIHLVSVHTQTLRKKNNKDHIAWKINWISFKVQLFWEGHKNMRNRPYAFEIYLVNVKAMRTIAQIFVAFSEKLNFNLVWKFQN